MGPSFLLDSSALIFRANSETCRYSLIRILRESSLAYSGDPDDGNRVPWYWRS